MIRTAALVAAASLLGAGCPKGDGASQAPSGTPASSATQAPATSAKPLPARVACREDEHCINSCSQGAVSKGWYQKSFPGGESCEDGCAGIEAGPPQCIEGRCVAFDRKGERVPSCTDRTDTPVEEVGPAHRCQKDDDCIRTCAYGAVNAQWHSYGATKKCKDGCASKGSEDPKCENGICVAYQNGQRDEACTQKSIW